MSAFLGQERELDEYKKVYSTSTYIHVCGVCPPDACLWCSVQMIQLYQRTLSDVSALDKVAFFPMVRLECEQAKGGIAELAEKYLTRLHTSLAEQHLRENQRWVAHCGSVVRGEGTHAASHSTHTHTHTDTHTHTNDTVRLAESSLCLKSFSPEPSLPQRSPMR